MNSSGTSSPDFAKVQESKPECYLWRARGVHLRVVISSEAAERMRSMAAPILRAASGENAGLLFGSIRSGVVTVQKVVPVAWPRDLSAGERRALESALAAVPAESATVAGFFRVQPGNELFLNAVDLALIQGYFPDPAHLFLLVGTGGMGARYFYRQGVRMMSEPSAPGMPFGQPLLGAESARLAGEGARESAGEYGDYRDAAPAPFSRKAGLLVIGALAIVAAAFAYSYLTSAHPGKSFSVASVPAAQQQLSLSVEKRAGEIVVHWDRTAPAIAAADRGRLIIQDGPNRNPYDLDLDQLRTGTIYYTPGSSDVQLRLEVYGSGDARPAVESVRVLSAVPDLASPALGSPALTNPLPPLAGLSDSRPRPARARRDEESEAARDERPAPPPLRFAPLGGSKPVAEVALEGPPELLASTPRTLASGAALPGARSGFTVPAPAPAPKPAAAAPQPAPVRISSYVGPKPVRQVQPTLPPRLIGTLQGNPEVSVRVSVDTSGRVTQAVVASQTGGVSPWVARATLDAAREWRFQPATSAGQPIASTVVLNFRFVR